MRNLETESRKIRRTSSGSVVLRKVDGAWYVLLLRAWGHWDFPKGNVEHGETLMDAALREVEEETGISDLEFPWGAAFARTAVYSRDKVAYYSIATTKTSCVVLVPNPSTGLREHDEYKWVPWGQVSTFLSPRLGGIIDWVDSVAKMVETKSLKNVEVMNIDGESSETAKKAGKRNKDKKSSYTR